MESCTGSMMASVTSSHMINRIRSQIEVQRDEIVGFENKSFGVLSVGGRKGKERKNSMLL